MPCTGILLVNLGTPDAPTPSALRRYLGQFLGDRRVVEWPRWLWWPLLHGILLNLRPRVSARRYAGIWTTEGSPLLLHTRHQAHLLGSFLDKRVPQPCPVEFGMCYGNPSIESALKKLQAQHCNRILVLPLYPQYAASSTAAAMDAVWRTLIRTRNLPEIRTVRNYHDNPGYIAALAASVHEHWTLHGQPDQLVMSFHGMPRATLEQGDPYHCECQKTARLLAESLQLARGQYRVCFQSRFGRARWLQPELAASLRTMAKQGVRRVDVVCPGFASDCLETLEEAAIEGKATFLAAGGSEFHYIPALNERSDWIDALGDLVLRHLQGWLDPDWDPEQVEAEGQRTRQRALEMGSRT